MNTIRTMTRRIRKTTYMKKMTHRYKKETPNLYLKKVTCWMGLVWNSLKLIVMTDCPTFKNTLCTLLRESIDYNHET